MLWMALIAAPFAGDDPWRASALISALSQLVLAILFLLQTVMACLTVQVIKCFGLGNSCCYASYHHYFNNPSLARHLPREFKEMGASRCGHSRSSSRAGASSTSQPSFYSNPYKLVRGLKASLARTISTELGFFVRRRPKTQEDEYSFSGLENRENVSSRSRNQDWRGSKATTLVCPNCNAAWTVPRTSLSKDTNDGLQERSHQDDGLAGRNDEELHSQAVATSPVGTDGRWGSVRREGDSAKTQKENEGRGDFDVSHELEAKSSCDTEMRSPPQIVIEDAWNEKVEESTGRVSPFLVEDGEAAVLVPLSQLQAGSDTAGDEAIKRLSDIPERLRSKLSSRLKEVAEDSSGIGMAGSVENCDALMDTEPYPELEGDYGSSGADVITSLRNALRMERKALCDLYEEFEEERNAAETAANEAIGMISRLQKEKAALQMKSAHYQRMAEEKAIHDERAMQLLKEVLYKRERENSVLEKEVRLFKRRFFREVSRAAKRRKEYVNLSLAGREPEPMLLLESCDGSVPTENQVNSTADLTCQCVEQKCNMLSDVGSGQSLLAEPSFRTEVIDEQPHKRLKGSTEQSDASNQFGLQCLLDGFNESSISASGHANEFEVVRQTSFPHRKQSEQCEQSPGMPDPAVDEDETNAILHQLKALEQQFHVLGDVAGSELHNLAQFIEDHSMSDAMKSASTACVAKDQVTLDSSCLDVVRILSNQNESEAVKCNEEGLTVIRDSFCTPVGTLECSGAQYFDKRISLDIDSAISCPQSRDGTGTGTVHDTNNLLREYPQICFLQCAGNVIPQDNISTARKIHCVSFFPHDEVTVAKSSTSISNISKDTGVAPISNAGPVCSINVDTQHQIIAQSKGDK